eukprot:3295596-Amphidinium_carterae.1
MACVRMSSISREGLTPSKLPLCSEYQHNPLQLRGTSQPWWTPVARIGEASHPGPLPWCGAATQEDGVELRGSCPWGMI